MFSKDYAQIDKKLPMIYFVGFTVSIWAKGQMG